MNWLRFFTLALVLGSLLPSAMAQQKIFNWVENGQEQFRLQPTMYYAVGPFTSSSFQPVTIKLGLQAAKPVLVGVVSQEAWNYVLQNPQAVLQLRYWCLKESVLQLDYGCSQLNALEGPYVVVVHDLTDPNAKLGKFLLGGLGVYLHSKTLVERAVAEDTVNNDVSVTHYSWKCAQNCDLPVFAWGQLVKEKFPIMRVTKSYGPFTPERNGDVMRISLNSPVPMAFATLSPQEATRLRERPDLFDSLAAKSKCQQRAVQKTNVTCTFSLSDGPQEIVLLPESGVAIPANKKASFSVSSPHCIENCRAE